MENSNNISKREQLLKFVPDDTLLFADGFDDAIMGLDTNSLRVVYSKQKKVRQLAKSVQLATCGIFAIFFNFFGELFQLTTERGGPNVKTENEPKMLS